MCGQPGIDDFYVIHHEMGHIEYYMAYEQQPAIFQVITIILKNALQDRKYQSILYIRRMEPTQLFMKV